MGLPPEALAKGGEGILSAVALTENVASASAKLRQPASIFSSLVNGREIDTPEEATPYPLDTSDRYTRGTFIHLLLEYLPELPAEDRRRAANLLADLHRIPSEAAEAWTRETLALLASPQGQAFFASPSTAEVPLAGFVNGRQISRRIDRLIVTAESVTILEYKTDRDIPPSEADIRPAYLRQMEEYRTLLQPIYPGCRLRSFFLWTAGPVFMEVMAEAAADTATPSNLKYAAMRVI